MRSCLFSLLLHVAAAIECNVWNRFNHEDSCQSSIGCVAIAMNGLVHRYSDGAPYYKFVNTAVAGCPESSAHLDVFEDMKLRKEIGNLCEKAQSTGGCLRNLTILPYMHNKIWISFVIRRKRYLPIASVWGPNYPLNYPNYYGGMNQNTFPLGGYGQWSSPWGLFTG